MSISPVPACLRYFKLLIVPLDLMRHYTVSSRFLLASQRHGDDLDVRKSLILLLELNQNVSTDFSNNQEWQDGGLQYSVLRLDIIARYVYMRHVQAQPRSVGRVD